MPTGYYLTKHPSTRPSTLSPGTPERPLSDLGLKGYTTYWVSVILRFLRQLLADAEPFDAAQNKAAKKGRPSRGSMHLRRRSSVVSLGQDANEHMSEDAIIKEREPYRGQYSVSLRLSALAKACHLRVDDTAFALGELGFLSNQRPLHPQGGGADTNGDEFLTTGTGQGRELGECSAKEVVVSLEQVDEAWSQWRIREKGVLDEDCLLL